MARKQVKNDYPFYQALLAFYNEKKGIIKKHYRDVTKKFIDYNDKNIRPDAYLRKPQFEALEIYIFIKEFLNNQSVKNMFADWYNKKGYFESRNPFRKKLDNGQMEIDLLDDVTAEVYNDVFDQLSVQDESYPNYIYALTMGLGKTILMATCIYYEFILSSKFPKDDRYCHNALVFAPDKTVLESLKEIKTFDMKKVVPPEYVSFLSANISFHYLDSASTTLNTIDGSDYNVIISNVQKIILKTKHTEKTAAQKIFDDNSDYYEIDLLDDFTKNLYSDIDMMRDGEEVTTNQRFQKIIRLKQLGIYVDEAHHLFGTELKKSLSEISESAKSTSLRFTINKIAEALSKNSEKVVACYNYTGTPYVESKILPEVVYTFGLKEAIYDGYLKEVDPNGYDNVKDKDYLKIVINDFFNTYGNNLYEGLLPKIAIYCATIEELNNVVKPEIENILNDLNIDISTILVNNGESKNTDIKEFNELDTIGTEGSKKQVILLVGKGREGWNCRSLFAVALFRSPKNAENFVLQSTMRCLRQITDVQQRAKVYLSKENYDVLDAELHKNFNINIKELKGAKEDKIDVIVHIIKPDKNIKINEIKKKYTLIDKTPDYNFDINIDKIDVDKYKSYHIERTGLNSKYGETIEEIKTESNRHYSKYSICFEIARYLNKSPLYINDILESSGKFDDIENIVSLYNEILYDYIIPKLFEYLYELKEETVNETKTIPLIKYRKDTDHFVFRTKSNLLINMKEKEVKTFTDKSFHVDNYCFDSEPEKRMFLQYLNSDKVKEVYFTGMFTGSENGLSVQYIDPNSNIIRTYYPDILVIYQDDKIEIVEVKGDNKIDDLEVEAKAYAAMELADASKMTYNIYKSSDIMKGQIKIQNNL